MLLDGKSLFKDYTQIVIFFIEAILTKAWNSNSHLADPTGVMNKKYLFILMHMNDYISTTTPKSLNVVTVT